MSSNQIGTLIQNLSYQCAFETFSLSGYSEKEAGSLMRKSVQLADQAKNEFLNDTRLNALSQSALLTTNRDIKVVLSLGPYGATLNPAQEFDGFYPPPYGPRAFTPEQGTLNTNAYSIDEHVSSESSIKALAAFHLRRLMVFTEPNQNGEEVNFNPWPHIDAIAFETVPLSREIIAIRSAMSRLNDHLKTIGLPTKPWWVSTVWPDGQFPEERRKERISAESLHLTPADVASALIGETTFCDKPLPKPDGVGINCTHLSDIDVVLTNLRSAIDGLSENSRPFLVLYPNGGAKYDPVNHRWLVHDESSTSTNPEEKDKEVDTWSDFLSTIVKREHDTNFWSGVLVGGCCKTGPKHIDALKKALLRLGFL